MRNIKQLAALLVMIGSISGGQLRAEQPPSTRPAGPVQSREPATQPHTVSPNKLTLAWNREKYEVPEPAVIPQKMEQTEAYRSWWKVGDVRIIEYTDEQGMRYVAEAASRIKDDKGQIKPMIPCVSRYRADGTLETKTMNTPQGPAEWKVFEKDGKTLRVRVTNRVDGLPGAPFIQYVDFYGADGKIVRRYQANRHAVVYLEWFYDATGQVTHYNGTSRLNGPLAERQ